ncbi:MAG: uracil-DNA glycosylase [Thermoplasmatales archaeon]|nr:uracil-DNA glycosylase [Thermoplasmatales archaeon]
MRPPRDCSLCPLGAGRTKIVMPYGDPNARVALVGEAPGEREDLTGLPFVGRAGAILDEMLAEARIDRGKLMITNAVKCRPPGNRDPTPEEIAACRPFLMSELAGRDLVVGLGKSACAAVAGMEGSMARFANTSAKIRIGGKDVRFMYAYHPMATIYYRKARDSLRETFREVALWV